MLSKWYIVFLPKNDRRNSGGTFRQKETKNILKTASRIIKRIIEGIIERIIKGIIEGIIERIIEGIIEGIIERIKIFPKYSQDIHKKSSRYPQNIIKIFPKYLYGISKISPKYP